MAKRIIITGAAGFIGCNTVRALNARGHTQLLLVDRLGCDERWANLVGLSFDDLISPEALLEQLDDDSLDDTQTIIHLGACSATTEKNADFLLENNTHYTQQLCLWCVKHDVRFVYASSAATYGDGAKGYDDVDAVTPTLRPLNMYGYSKQLFDLWALRRGLFDRIVGLKYFNVFGPHEDHKGDMRSVVHKAYHEIRDAGQVKLFKSYRPDYTDGQQQRDFIYVKDAIDVTLHFADTRSGGGLFNCGSGVARSWNDLANAVFGAMDRKPNLAYVDMPPALQGKYQYFTRADISKLRASGYTEPMTTLEDGVRDYVQNYLAGGERG